MAKSKVGALVWYHGAKVNKHGMYRVRSSGVERNGLDPNYEVHYVLAKLDRSEVTWPELLYNVRRESFTVIKKAKK